MIVPVVFLQFFSGSFAITIQNRGKFTIAKKKKKMLVDHHYPTIMLKS